MSEDMFTRQDITTTVQTRAFLFLVFPTLLRLPQHLRAWNRLLDRETTHRPKGGAKGYVQRVSLVKGSFLGRLGENKNESRLLS